MSSNKIKSGKAGTKAPGTFLPCLMTVLGTSGGSQLPKTETQSAGDRCNDNHLILTSTACGRLRVVATMLTISSILGRNLRLLLAAATFDASIHVELLAFLFCRRRCGSYYVLCCEEG